MELFILVGLPYIAVVTCVVGTVYRFRSQRFGISARSSQFLENRGLVWGSVPWHIGIIVLFLGHLIPFLFPGLWRNLVASRGFLITVEIIGLAAALLAVAGLVVLIVRRIVARRMQPVTNVMDIVVLVLLLAQVVLGIVTAVSFRWGASWSTGTVVPYLWSIATLQPDPAYVAAMPAVLKAHIAGAWLILMLVPFSRLIHMFDVPLGYIVRPFQKVVWTTTRRRQHAVETYRTEVARRHFIRGGLSLAAATGLLAVGVLDTMFGFFRGPQLEPEERAEIGEQRLRRLEKTAEEKELELERIRSRYIPVARLSELDKATGHYFIDYQMRPALAFATASGLPHLISAKCTHLGCTVGSEADSDGRILCPCHVSWFSIDSGRPNSGAPAKVPLPILGWVVMNPDGEIVAERSPGANGVVTGTIDMADAPNLVVHIVREHQDEATA